MADISITRNGRIRRDQVLFKLTPTLRSTSEWLFIPAEIIHNAGKPLDETDESSWD